MNTAPCGRDAEARATSAHPTKLHAYHAPPTGSVVDLDRCIDCGYTAGDSHHAVAARVPEARAEIEALRAEVWRIIAAKRASGGADETLFVRVEAGLRRASNLLQGLSPNVPHQPLGELPETAQERQTALPGVA